MPQYSEAHYWTIVVVDVARFTDPSRKLLHQVAVHGGLEDLLERAFDESGIDWKSCDVEDRGDGKMILVPPEVPKARLVDQLWSRLLAELRRHNAVHANPSAMQLRVALHAGEVRTSSNGKVSPAINFAFRILEAQEAKVALAQTKSDLAFIVSDPIYRDVVEQEPAAEPGMFRQISVSVKQTEDVAWLRLPNSTWTVGGAASDDVLVVEAVQRWRVLDLLPESELSRLREWLVETDVPQLPTLVRRAVGRGVSSVPRGSDAWGVFLHLADFNAGADGFPPALSFLELLARQVGGRLSEALMEWNDAQARRLRLESALRMSRTSNAKPIAIDSPLHLVIVIEPDGMDQDRYLLSHWRQDDPVEWPPARGDIREATANDLQLQVDELIVEAELAWTGRDCTVALEVVLPRALLNEPVHCWPIERESGDPLPLYLDYPVVVRSLERMRSRHWHRRWRRRWQTLMADPSAALVHFARPMDPDAPHVVSAVLEQEPQFVSIVLAGSPPNEPRPGDQLTAALRSGLPAVLWHRGNGDSDSVREAVTWLVEDGGLADLPARTQSLRQDAYLGSRFDTAVSHDLVLLWDDPNRVVALDELVG